MKEILIATSNAGKIKEFNTKLSSLGYNCISLSDIGYNKEIEETGETFLENALIKAKTVSKEYQNVVIADDSGLIVEALPNELGIKSKRFSKEGTDKANNLLLLKKLKNIKNRKAYFICQIVVYFPTSKFYTYQGKVSGVIAKDFQGDYGFGYDPLFIVDGLNKRMAELTKEEKNQISHRGNALDLLIRDIINETIII